MNTEHQYDGSTPEKGSEPKKDSKCLKPLVLATLREDESWEQFEQRLVEQFAAKGFFANHPKQ